MKNIKWLLVLALAATAVACDPYDDVKGGTPNVASVTASDVSTAIGYEGTANASGAWTVDIACTTLCDQLNDPCDAADEDLLASHTDLSEMIVWVTFDRQINGNAVQTALDDCTPAGGWLTATPAPAAGEQWFSCYAPSSAQPTEGGSAVLFTGETPAVGAHVSTWGDSFTAVPTGALNFTGNVAGREINVTVNRPATCVCTDPA